MSMKWIAAPLAGLLLAAPAEGYVRSRSNACNVIYWPGSCVFLYPDLDLYPEMKKEDVTRIIQQSIDNWMSRTTSAYLQLIYNPPTVKRETRFDHIPVIKFRTEKWCRPPAKSSDKEVCYDPSAAAITTVFFLDKDEDEKLDGQVVDADIELNAVYNRFYEDRPGVSPPARTDARNLTDLENTLTHELGHLMGLDHTCRTGITDTTSACSVDENNKLPPRCNDVLQMVNEPRFRDIADTTMFATAPPMETKKRTPEADDIAGIAAAYPKARDPSRCEEPREIIPCDKNCGKGCACEAASGRRAPLPLALLFPALLFVHRLRRALKARQPCCFRAMK